MPTPLADMQCQPCSDVGSCPTSSGGPPGPQGPSGVNGTNGTNGVNSYSTSLASFTVPAVGNSVVVSVSQSSWMVVGQIVYVGSAGYYQVANKATGSATLTNLGYDGNAAPTTLVGSAQTISPGGIEGPAGALTGAAGGVLAGTYPNPTLAASGVVAGTWTKVTVNAGGQVTTGALIAAADVPSLASSKITSGTFPIARGGTNASTQVAAFNNLSPGTTKGDLIVHDGTNNIRVGVGANSTVLVANSAASSGASWLAPEIIQNSTPLTGDNVIFATVLTNETLYITPAGTLATLSLTLPADANSHIGQICRAFTSQTLTSLTVSVSGGSYVGTTVTTLAQYGTIIFQKVAANLWIRLL